MRGTTQLNLKKKNFLNQTNETEELTTARLGWFWTRMYSGGTVTIMSRRRFNNTVKEEVKLVGVGEEDAED